MYDLEYIVICITSLFVSIITLFSGFGLGTVLMPVFALFFPLPIAIASTAVVHLLNNFFKAAIVGRLANRKIVYQFGIPAAIASAIGAYFLATVSKLPPILTYSIHNREFNLTIVGLVIGLIIIASSFMELIPILSKITFPSRFIPIGGALSGFFGGLSGNQGILRSAFLIKAVPNKEEFIGTSVITSILVDAVRILVYGWSVSYVISSDMTPILIAATLTAFLGSFIGSKLIEKITFNTIQWIVGLMLLVLGSAIALGIS